MTVAVQLGEGAHTYRNDTDWAKLPEGIGWREVAGVVVGLDKKVYVFARGDYPVVVFDADGTYLANWGQGLCSNPHAITLGPSNTFYVTDHFGHAIRQVNYEGELLLTIGEPGVASELHGGRPFNMPTDVAVDPSTGDLFISDGYKNSAIHRFSAEGEHILSWGGPGVDPGEFSIPHNIDTDSDGYVYVADRENHRIQVFDGEGNFQTQFNNVHRPCALRVGSDGLIYVGELGFSMKVNQEVPNIGPRVSILNKSGERLAKVGHLGFGLEPGQMVAPHGIAVDAVGDIYLGEVSDTASKAGTAGPTLPGIDQSESILSFRKLVRE